MIRFACPSCNKTLGIDDRFAGRRIACPQCQAELMIPSADAPISTADKKKRVEATYADADDRMRLKRSIQEDDDLDMTPMVDVTFLLLIFFMITASFQLQKSLPASPPEPDEAAAAAAVIPDEPKDDPIVLEIDADDTLYLDGKKLLLGELEAALTELRIAERVEELLVEADPEAKHGTVIIASDAAIRAGYTSIKRKSAGVSP